MEEDKGLDLSLGLPTGGSSSKSNEKSNTSLDVNPNGTDRTSKILSDFRNFLNGGVPQQPQGSYFNNFPQSAIAGHPSGDGNATRFRTSASSTEKGVELEGEKAPMSGDKRQNLYDEMNPHKKQETDRNSDLHDRGRTSRISITTDDGSTADNEDVAESEAATSRPLPNLEENSRQHVDSRSSAERSKDLHGKVNVSLPPFSLQSVSSMNVPCSITFKEAVPVGAPASSVYPTSGVIQSSMTGDRTQTLNVGNTPITFGYSHGQLQFSDKDSPWGSSGRLPLHNPYSRPLPASGTSHSLSEGKQPAGEEGSSTRAEDEFRASNTVFRGKTGTEPQTENSFPSEYPAIRPGMAADLKFGGSGSLPNLPWVSTTGPGPNGRTISGVTYRFSANQIKIVCACHGLHMSPEDFIQHASEEPPSVTDSAAGSSTGGGGGSGGGGGGSGLASFPGTSNAATSVKS